MTQPDFREPRRRRSPKLLVVGAALGAVAIAAGAVTIAPYLSRQSTLQDAAATSSLDSTQCTPGYAPSPGLTLEVCLTGHGNTVTPWVTIASLADTGNTCTIAPELWDDAGNRLDDAAVSPPRTCDVGQLTGPSVDLGTLTGVSAHTAPDGSLAVHSHARVMIDGQDTYAPGEGDSPAITVPGTLQAPPGSNPPGPTPSASTTTQPDQPTDPPAPTSATASCQIDVRANFATGSGPVYHLYVIYTDQAGDPFVFRAGPTTKVPGNFGVIVTYHARYDQNALDWPTTPGTPSTTVLAEPAACGKDTCFTTELDRIGAAQIPYQPLGRNSNSVAYTILSNCGVPTNKPVAVAPGWGILL
jgi:hypothetical protein